MTPQAVEIFICDDFILEDSYVPHGAMVTHALATQLEKFLELLEPKDCESLKQRPLVDVIATFRQQRSRADSLVKSISEYGHRSLAASFAIRAKKPDGYDQGTSGNSTPADRAAYYAARLAVIQRHHEIGLYRKLTIGLGKNATTYDIPNLYDILSSGTVTNPQADNSYRNATRSLAEWNSNLTKMRDEVIALYTN